MNFLIDTSVAIQLRDGDSEIVDKVGALDGALMMSVVTRVELANGVYKTNVGVEERLARLEPILSAIPALSFDEDAVQAYGAIVERVGYSRRKLLDRMIAAQALVQNATLVTLNAADFNDVPGLRVLAW